MHAVQRCFSADFNYNYEGKTGSPLVVSPKSAIDFITWARTHQTEIAAAVKEQGALVFSGCNLTQESFREAFTAITGMAPQVYKGDTPRDEVSLQIYKSTAVANGHTIPLHQEVSGGARTDMPRYISFFCETPPATGTGQTLVGNARLVTQKIKASMPALWRRMSTQKLTYTARYLPTNSWRTKWIRWLNPSHATIEQRFGTKNREEVEAKCRLEGLTCEWDGDWAVISRKGVPATINVDGEELFCNQIHLDKISPKLCGGWINYLFAWILLYPTSRSRQFNVKFEDSGPEISRRETTALLNILEGCQQGRNWKKGDLMVVHNPTTMHAKTAHVGKREILVAMGGSVVDAL
jgi:alpha-ketoglutarate-dependent taurine dioxygenase